MFTDVRALLSPHRLFVYQHACANAIDFLDSLNHQDDFYRGNNYQPLRRLPTLSTSPLLLTRTKVIGAIAEPEANIDIEFLVLSLNALSVLLGANALPQYFMTDVLPRVLN